MHRDKIRVRVRSNYEFKSLIQEGYNKCLKGEIWHLALSFVRDKKDIDKIELFIKKALSLLGERVEKWDIKNNLVTPLKKVFNLKEVDLFFSPHSQQILCEKNIIVPDDKGGFKEYRPDRVVVFEDKIVVVDFKSEKPSDKNIYNKYVSQVKGYVEELKKLFNAPVEGYLLFISNPKVEKVS